ncbi:malonyl-CoA synthase [Afifella sp. IM 167]|uniref:malonate--CoA ligase n=1 Tax=Afifella sp. IM 167 TaxID=2033586 RepID=UPI001CCFA3A4|nr:malonyl-CoA synthase [Afifella sp. IM 167]MBZ8133708.1 malonyl-CoA synthase [Afifella sp. IM 167]
MDRNLYSRLAAAFSGSAQATPFAELADGRILTYRDLDKASARFANALVSLGVRPGERVAAQVEKSIGALMLYLGTVRAGAIFLPLNTGYTPAELEYFVGDAEPAIFVCDPAKAERLRETAEARGARLETLGTASTAQEPDGTLAKAAFAASSAFDTVERSDSDLAAILYTSGTTGRSKGAMLSHDNLASNAFALRDLWRFTSEDVLLHALPIYHTHGLFTACNTLMAAGASMIFLPRFSLDEVIAALPRATSMMGVPTFYTRLLSDPRFSRELVAHMRLFTSGSAPLLASTHAAFAERTGHDVLERYGMTETNMNTSNPYDGERRAGTVGFPLPGVSLRIADPGSGEEKQRGEIGVIEVMGPNVFKGYWRMPEKTAMDFRGGHFITGDLGLIDADGYVHIVGRAKDLIISGGLNIYPKEIELVLDEMPGVAESAVIGVPHADFGEAVVAVVVPEDGVALSCESIGAALRDRLASFKQPKRIIVVEELPRNTMGKVEKSRLRAEFAQILSEIQASEPK